MESSKGKKATAYINDLNKNNANGKEKKKTKKTGPVPASLVLGALEKALKLMENYDPSNSNVSEINIAIEKANEYLPQAAGYSIGKLDWLTKRQERAEILRVQQLASEYPIKKGNYLAKLEQSNAKSNIEEKIPIQESPLETVVKEPEATAPKVEQAPKQQYSFEQVFNNWKARQQKKGSFKEHKHHVVFIRDGKYNLKSLNKPDELQEYVQDLTAKGCPHQIFPEKS